MSSIDERIVDMQFNNGQFEKGIKTSLDSLGQLDKGLNLSKIKDSLAYQFIYCLLKKFRILK